MSDLGFNKIAGALLATGLAILMLREGSDMLFDRTHPPEKAGYRIDVPEEAGGGPGGPSGPPDWGTVLPAADIAAGQQAAQAKCASCHHFDGSNSTGPGLLQILGRPVAAHAGFDYSGPMRGYASQHATWTYDSLDEFLTNPQRAVPGSRMTFAGIRNVEERVNVIAYLRTLGSTNVPIPPPRPAAAAPAEGAATNGAGATNAAGGEATNATAPGATATTPGQTGAPSAGGGTAPAASTGPTTQQPQTPAPASQASTGGGH